MSGSHIAELALSIPVFLLVLYLAIDGDLRARPPKPPKDEQRRLDNERWRKAWRE